MGKDVDAEEVLNMSEGSACKLFGAYRTAISIKDAAVLIHSTIGCNWGTNNFHITSMQQDVRQASSVLYEEDVIYGGEKALKKAIEYMQELYDYSALFVLTGCVAEIMGDDIEGVIRNFSSPKPIIPINAAGFKGDIYSGVEDVMKVIIDYMEVKYKNKNSINIIGFFSDDFKSNEDLDSIKKLLGKDIKINSIIPYDNYSNILNAAKAELNVVIEGFESIGRYMEERLGIPYVVVKFPYGIEGSKDFAIKVFNAMNLEVDDSIGEMEIRAIKNLERVYGYIHKLYGMPVVIRGDHSRGPALKKFLQGELGMNVDIFNDDSNNFEEVVEESDAVIIFGSSYERGIADKLSIPLIRYNYPIFDAISIGNRSYAGFEGTINLIEDIINSSMTANYRRDGMYGFN